MLHVEWQYQAITYMDVYPLSALLQMSIESTVIFSKVKAVAKQISYNYFHQLLHHYFFMPTLSIKSLHPKFQFLF